jgi:hypothetical protein
VAGLLRPHRLPLPVSLDRVGTHAPIVRYPTLLPKAFGEI